MFFSLRRELVLLCLFSLMTANLFNFQEEMEDPAQLGSRVQDYLRDYKIFSEKITNVIRQASQEKMTEEQKQIIGALVSDLDVDIERSASLYYMLVIF